VGRHGNDRQVPARFPFGLADGRGRFQSVENRHLDVHQNQVERLAAHGVDRIAAVLGQRRSHSVALEQLDGQPLVDAVVLGHEDP